MTLPTPRLPLRTEPWPSGSNTTTCPVCGLWWRPFAGSILPAHAMCLYTFEDAERIRQMILAATEPIPVVAARLEVPIQVVRAIMRARHHYAERRRRRS